MTWSESGDGSIVFEGGIVFPTGLGGDAATLVLLAPGEHLVNHLPLLSPFNEDGSINADFLAGFEPAGYFKEPSREPVDIVDAIDELVNDQLAPGPVDDYTVDRYDRCPHCDRQWHGLKITVRIEKMRAMGQFDQSYRYADDVSEVICEGSDFIGPQRYPPVLQGAAWEITGPGWPELAALQPEEIR